MSICNILITLKTVNQQVNWERVSRSWIKTKLIEKSLYFLIFPLELEAIIQTNKEQMDHYLAT